MVLYADDTKVFRRIQDVEDCNRLQGDLDELRKWTEKLLLLFHPEKSKYMKIGNTSVDDNEYIMYIIISKTRTERDIGVVIDDKLTFADHLAEKIEKANKIVGLIKRTFVFLEPATFKPLFTSLVRPHLEYANQVWCPQLIKDINAIENVQRRVSKLVSCLKELPYEERLKRFDLPSLTYGRSRGDKIETFKIVNNKYDKECTEGLFRMREDSVTRGHKKLFKAKARLNSCKYSFPNRVVNIWNNLPDEMVHSETVTHLSQDLINFVKHRIKNSIIKLR
ncbi:uncharacterized protein [Palaemon carinicauda]|uniref:uncharacterized protein n=1 Tax=Palaemon carinicauda TaxID=392227 RepID=UPI0035B58A59